MEQKFVFENDIVQWSVKIFVVFYSHFAFFHSWLHIPPASHDAFALVPKWSIILKKKIGWKGRWWTCDVSISTRRHHSIRGKNLQINTIISTIPQNTSPSDMISQAYFFRTSMLIYWSLDFFLKTSSLPHRNFHL